MKYTEFILKKSQLSGMFGFDSLFDPDYLFDFQKHLVNWSLKKGKGAIFADTGLGKTIMQLVWAQNIVQKTNKNVLILSPLAVSHQTVKEGEKFGIEVQRSRDGKPKGKITITNYQQLEKFNSNDFVGCVCDESSAIKNFAGATKMGVTRL
jgi:SNF2 family DNA or RNA helicase